jgi:hypothetical protein
MENEMNCKNLEEKILEVLDGEELLPAISSHVNECPSCSKFYKYILSLKEGLNKIEQLEPSLDFDAKIIEKLKAQPSYWKILTFISPLVIFISFVFSSIVAKKYFVEIIISLGKIWKIAETLSGSLLHGYSTVAVLCFVSLVFFVIASGVFDVFLLSKLIKNGGVS